MGATVSEASAIVRHGRIVPSPLALLESTCRLTPSHTRLSDLPPENLANIGSFCSYRTLLSLGRLCLAFRNLPHTHSLVRTIAESACNNSEFNVSGRWSAILLDL